MTHHNLRLVPYTEVRIWALCCFSLQKWVWWIQWYSTGACFDSVWWSCTCSCTFPCTDAVLCIFPVHCCYLVQVPGLSCFAKRGSEEKFYRAILVADPWYSCAHSSIGVLHECACPASAVVSGKSSKTWPTFSCSSRRISLPLELLMTLSHQLI